MLGPAVRIALVAPFGLRAKGTTRARSLPLGQALVRLGYEVALFVPPYDSREDSGRRWEDAGVTVVNVPLPPDLGRSGIAQGLWHLGIGWRTYQAVRAWRPQIVHVFKPKGPSGLVGALMWQARRLAPTGRGPRLVIDSDDWEGAGGWNDDPRTGYSSWQRRFFAWQERFGLGHADAWTVTSACLRERAVAFGADPARVYDLPNGLSELGRRLLTAEIPHGETAAALLYTRFAGVQPAEVAALWAAVHAVIPQATLTVAGRGLGGEERKLAGEPGVELAGWQEPAAMPALLSRHTLGVAPWADTPANRARHSVKVLELMAAGLPVVAYGVGELPATLGDAGVTVPPADRAAFVAEVVALLRDPSRAAQLGVAARARVTAYYGWDTLAESALRAYQLDGK